MKNHYQVKFEEAEKEIAALKAQLAQRPSLAPQWIPVSERLPKERIRVIAWATRVMPDAFYGVSSNRDFPGWNEIIWRQTEDESPIAEVTHWMPLPDAPGAAPPSPLAAPEGKVLVRADEYEALRQLQFYARHPGQENMVVRFLKEISGIDASTPPSHIERTTNAPFKNCRYQECDLPGQCIGEGKCHHPAKAFAPSATLTTDVATVTAGGFLDRCTIYQNEQCTHNMKGLHVRCIHCVVEVAQDNLPLTISRADGSHHGV